MDRRQQKTRTAIYKALTELLKKKRFEDITVRQIIDEANIGRSTFYSYFETKDQLLLEMCNELFAHVLSDSLLPEKSHDFSTDHEDSGALMEHILWHIKDHEANIRSIMNGESEKIFTKYFSAYLENTFGDRITNLNIDVSDEFKKQFFIGSFTNTVKWWISTGLKQKPKDIIDDYMKCLNKGKNEQ
ncbi:MAG: TetR/AcrR family transcriptional regulator, partial [Lachnospiraceae bacterium]|nr:TetR/AcrR family transcriptional regulator [Lachnospiraceae bacterium]